MRNRTHPQANRDIYGSEAELAEAYLGEKIHRGAKLYKDRAAPVSGAGGGYRKIIVGNIRHPLWEGRAWEGNGFIERIK